MLVTTSSVLILPIPDCPPRRAHHIRRQGPGDGLPADRAAAPARWRTERPHRPARRRRLRRLVGLRGPRPHPDRRAPCGRRPHVQPLPHHGDVRADPPGAPHRPQPSHGRDGRHHRARQRRARLHVDPPQHVCPARRDAEAERLLHRPVRQVPRGAGLGDEPDGAVPAVAHGQRLRALLRLHRRRDQPVLPRSRRGHEARRAGPDARGGLPPHRGPHRPGHRLGAAAEGPHV